MIDVKQKAMFSVRANRLLLGNITYADVANHALTPAALGLPDNVVGILGYFNRTVGAGQLKLNDSTGATACYVDTSVAEIWWKDDDGNFYCGLTVANDSFDLYTCCYFVEA